MTDSIAARFDPYDAEWLEWLNLKARAEKAGRTPREQAEAEERHAERVTEQTRRQVVAEINEQHAATGRYGWYWKRDRW